MKTKLLLLAGAVLAAIVVVTPGCMTVPVVDPTTGQTNLVQVIDTNKLAKVEQVVASSASSVFRRAIKNHPAYAEEISNYVRAVGTAFCAVHDTRQFSPAVVLNAVDLATAGQQAGVPDEIIDGKNALKTLYQILWDDKLTTQLPDNKWPAAVVQVFCASIDGALRDAGQPGVKVQ